MTGIATPRGGKELADRLCTFQPTEHHVGPVFVFQRQHRNPTGLKRDEDPQPGHVDGLFPGSLRMAFLERSHQLHCDVADAQRAADARMKAPGPLPV
jgi:hypothetical protein